jgi:hypothetical protein
MISPDSYKTPGVYIQEVSNLPPSVAQAPTGVAVFIGYTQKADDNGESLFHKPVRITSFAQYQAYFGGPPKYKFSAAATTEPDAQTGFLSGSTHYQLSPCVGTMYYLHNSLQLCYANGGGACYIVSVGAYPVGTGPTYADLKQGLDEAAKEDEPSLILIPDALLLNDADRGLLMRDMLIACKTTGDRMALFDIPGGDEMTDGKKNAYYTLIDNFKTDVGTDNLAYGAAYVPWLKTTIINPDDLGSDVLDDALIGIINGDGPAVALKASFKTKIATPPVRDKQRALTSNPLYKVVISAIANYVNVLPATPAIAGIYNMESAS